MKTSNTKNAIKRIASKMTIKDWLTLGTIAVSITEKVIVGKRNNQKEREWKYKHSQAPKWKKQRDAAFEEELKRKKEELELENEMHAERLRKACEIKKEYESGAESYDSEKEKNAQDKSVKDKVCRLLKIGYYCSPVQRKMLEENEKTIIHAKPTPLIGDMIKLGDRIVIAGTPGAGKSALVHQLCYEISSGEESKLLPRGSGCSKAQLVYLFDKELDSDDRIERDGCVDFNDEKLIRMDDFDYPTPYFFLSDIYDLAMGLNEDATVLLDNLYAIFPTMTSEQTKDLLEGLEKIQKIVGERGIKITFIIITHTTKDASGVPEMNDIAGSANLSRFARSVFILAATKHDGEAILINTKCRHNGRRDIALLTIATEPMLHLEYKRSISAEEAKLLTKSNGSSTIENETIKENPVEEFVEGTKYTQAQIEKVIKFKMEGLKYRDIAEKMSEFGVNMSQTTVMNLLKRFASAPAGLVPATA